MKSLLISERLVTPDWAGPFDWPKHHLFSDRSSYFSKSMRSHILDILQQRSFVVKECKYNTGIPAVFSLTMVGALLEHKIWMETVQDSIMMPSVCRHFLNVVKRTLWTYVKVNRKTTIVCAHDCTNAFYDANCREKLSQKWIHPPHFSKHVVKHSQGTNTAEIKPGYNLRL